MRHFLFIMLLTFVIPAKAGICSDKIETLKIGSKRFTESYVLGEIAKKSFEDQNFKAIHKQGMGGTIILWQALRRGAIDLYPDYTGTIREEILKAKENMTPVEMRQQLSEFGIGMSDELGFNNTYALVMRKSQARKLGIRKISDLKRFPELKFGFNHEFLNRQDGWKPLKKHYALPQTNVRGLEHSLAYSALANQQIDLMEAYSTDAKILKYDLQILKDDLHFFPTYYAVFLYRLSMPSKAFPIIQKFSGTFSEKKMIQLNEAAERTRDYTYAASLYFTGASDFVHAQASPIRKILFWTFQHLLLTLISLSLAILVGVPLGILAAKPGFQSQAILGITNMIYTIPSLALLALLVPVPFLGISATTAIVALFLYSLLPIVRNTATGLQSIPEPIRESAAALGLEPLAQLIKVYLPMASRTILAGIKTSTVLNIGTATIAALIGAGGLGEPILSGLNLNDHQTILQGAIPAALLALLAQFLFEFLDRVLIPRGLRR